MELRYYSGGNTVPEDHRHVLPLGLLLAHPLSILLIVNGLIPSMVFLPYGVPLVCTFYLKT